MANERRKWGDTYRRGSLSLWARRFWKWILETALDPPFVNYQDAGLRLGIDQASVSNGRNHGRLSAPVLVYVLGKVDKNFCDVPQLCDRQILSIAGYREVLPEMLNSTEKKSISLDDTCLLICLYLERIRFEPYYQSSIFSDFDDRRQSRLNALVSDINERASKLFDLCRIELDEADLEFLPTGFRRRTSDEMHQLARTWLPSLLKFLLHIDDTHYFDDEYEIP